MVLNPACYYWYRQLEEEGEKRGISHPRTTTPRGMGGPGKFRTYTNHRYGFKSSSHKVDRKAGPHSCHLSHPQSRACATPRLLNPCQLPRALIGLTFVPCSSCTMPSRIRTLLCSASFPVSCGTAHTGSGPNKTLSTVRKHNEGGGSLPSRSSN